MSFQNITISDLLKIAVLDFLYFTGIVMASTNVSAVTILVLSHCNSFSILIFAKFVFPYHNLSYLQYSGAFCIFLAVIICLAHPLIELRNSYRFDNSVIYLVKSSILYALSSIIQGLSSLYKENIVMYNTTTPLDVHYISMWLFLYQFGITAFSMYVIYLVQGKFISLLSYVITFHHDIFAYRCV